MDALSVAKDVLLNTAYKGCCFAISVITALSMSSSKQAIRSLPFTTKYVLSLTCFSSIFADKLDTGFRVLKLDSSNMQDVYYNPNAMRQSLARLARLEDMPVYAGHEDATTLERERNENPFME